VGTLSKKYTACGINGRLFWNDHPNSRSIGLLTGASLTQKKLRQN